MANFNMLLISFQIRILLRNRVWDYLNVINFYCSIIRFYIFIILLEPIIKSCNVLSTKFLMEFNIFSNIPYNNIKQDIILFWNRKSSINKINHAGNSAICRRHSWIRNPSIWIPKFKSILGIRISFPIRGFIFWNRSWRYRSFCLSGGGCWLLSNRFRLFNKSKVPHCTYENDNNHYDQNNICKTFLIVYIHIFIS